MSYRGGGQLKGEFGHLELSDDSPKTVEAGKILGSRQTRRKPTLLRHWLIYALDRNLHCEIRWINRDKGIFSVELNRNTSKSTENRQIYPIYMKLKENKCPPKDVYIKGKRNVHAALSSDVHKGKLRLIGDIKDRVRDEMEHRQIDYSYLYSTQSSPNNGYIFNSPVNVASLDEKTDSHLINDNNVMQFCLDFADRYPDILSEIDLAGDWTVIMIHTINIISTVSMKNKVSETEVCGSKGTGPIFIVEPQSRVLFLNSYGAVVNCLVHGEPSPSVQWINKNNEVVEEVPGLLKIFGNNSLSLSSFENGAYRQYIHSTAYRCRATNKYGTIVSRQVKVNAVVDQQYSIQVYDEYVIEGNTAVFKCIIPSYIRDYVRVTAWIKDDRIRMPVEYQNRSTFLIMNNGNLNIINVQKEDSGSQYKCQTEHIVNKVLTVTEQGGTLHITTPSSGIAPKIIDTLPEVQTISGKQIILPCSAQGYTKPKYSWCFMKVKGEDCKNLDISLKNRKVGGSLILTPAVKHSGFYVCRANNEMGDQKAITRLTVHAPLSAFIHPQRQIVDIGQYSSLSCVVTGGPLQFIKWMKDGQLLKNDYNAKDSSLSMLNITSVKKDSEGMYQCFVGNSLDEKQAIGQLILSGDYLIDLLTVPPKLKEMFDTQLNLGDRLDLFCALRAGDPPVKFMWEFNGKPVPYNLGVVVTDSVYKSDLNSPKVTRKHAGNYSCSASNRAGFASKLAIIKIQGATTENIKNSTNKIILYNNGTLVIKNIHEDDLKYPYQCRVSNGLEPSLNTDINLELQRERIRVETLHSTMKVNHGEEIGLRCKVYGNGPFNVKWKHGADFLQMKQSSRVKIFNKREPGFTESFLHIIKSQVSDSGLYSCHFRNEQASNSTRIYLTVINTFQENSRNTDLDSQFFASTMISVIDEPRSNRNDSNTVLKLEGMVLLYIIPTITAAIVLLTILIIVCVLLQSQRRKLQLYKHKDLDLRHSEMNPGHKDENKLGDFYKAPSESSSANKYYEIRPHGTNPFPHQYSSHSSSYNPELWTAEGSKGTGPIFIVEPPRKVAFTNTRGAIIDCLVHGDPNPTIQWIHKNNERVEEVQGLLNILANNSLSLIKFQNALYRQNIHATSYKCKASNKYGTIISREVQVTAVVNQQYSTQVYDEYVIEGNIALLKCIIPSYVRDYIKVNAWIRDDVVRIPLEYHQNSRYFILKNGNLNILNVSNDDSEYTYKCQTEHIVTKETMLTDTGGKLHVTKPSNGIQPRIVYNIPQVNTVSGDEVILPCVAEGYPAPTYSWCYKKYKGTACKEIQKDKGLNIVVNSLIMRASVQDSGFYMCKAKNKMGEKEVTTEMIVHAPLSAFIHPQRQIVEIEQEVSLSCVISGGPLRFIKWFNNGKFLKSDDYSLNKSRSTLKIPSVGRTSEGMYQCFVGNTLDEKQAIGQIILSAVPPVLVKVFKRIQKRPGQSVSLECSAKGEPLPQIVWSLRDSLVKNSFGSNIETRVESGTIWSKLTMDSLKIQNGGIYKCLAKNKAGEDSYANILDVYGPLRVWPLQNQTVVTGKAVVIQCHVSGYPISSIKWRKDGEDLLESERIKMHSNGTLRILSAIGNVDNGNYECIAENDEGDTSFGVGSVRIIGIKEVFNFISNYNNLSAPPEWKIKPTTLEVMYGESAILPCSGKAFPQPKSTWMKITDKMSDKLENGTSKLIIYGNGTLQINDISEDDLLPTYRCIISNGIPPSLITNIHLKLKSYRIQFETRQNTFSFEAKSSIKINCKASGIGPFKVQWLYASKALLPSSNSRIDIVNKQTPGWIESILQIKEASTEDSGLYTCQITNSNISNSTRIFVSVSGKDDGIGSRINENAVMTASATPFDESESRVNETSRDLNFSGITMLYIIPTATAATILLVILVIVCILLQRQQNKRKKYKNEGVSKEFEDDKISNFYKASSVASSSNKYYEIKPSDKYYHPNSATYKPGEYEIQPYATFSSNANDTWVATDESKGIGPIFIVEPPTKLAFLNIHGAMINCLVHGDPIPKVQWVNKNGQNVEDINGLLKKLENNSLSLIKFDNGLYRQNIHATTYICKASNKYGTIISREVHVTAVVDQHYSTQVYDEYVIEGNTAILKCIIPSYIKDQIIVTAWIRDDDLRIPFEYEQDSRYLILNSGDLNIINVRYGDSDSTYKCQTKHTVSGEEKVTDVGGKLHVTKPSSGIQPRIMYNTPPMNIVSGSKITLSSVAQGYPAPTYRIFQMWKMSTVGMYQCFIGNVIDEKQAIGQITLSAVPPTIVKVFKTRPTRPGQTVTLECAANGDPLPQIQWTLRDALITKSNGLNIESKVEADDEEISENERIIIYNNGTLKISHAIGNVDNGKYECTAENEEGYTSSGTGILRIIVAPFLKDTLKDETLRFGQRLHLFCGLTAGDPPIEFTWLYNGKVLPHYLGVIVSDSTYSSTLSHQKVGRNHMGNYSCIASNSAGSATKSTIVKVQAPPEWQVRPNKLEVDIGKHVSLQCSAKGFSSTKINLDDVKRFKEIKVKSFKLFQGRNLEKLVNVPNKRIVHQNGTLSLFNISEKDLQITYRCKISNGIPPPLVANIQLTLKKNKIVFEILKSTFQIGVGGSVDIKCKATGIGPFNVKWIHSSNTLSSMSNPRIDIVSSQRPGWIESRLKIKDVSLKNSGLYTCQISDDSKTGTSKDKDFRNPLMSSVVTPVDELSPNKNDSSKVLHFRSVAILYIIPTATAAFILLIILIIVCILLQRQRGKRTKYKHEVRKLENSIIMGKNLDEDDKISDFYKASSVTSSSNKYYEIRPHHPYQQSHSSAFKPGI
ncbi:Down syndrome cell adhesion molecule-like protein Dscam2 [Nymphon striatum]|nr:Down syndrome cell adhesion molecule-like protein Dscam2 [Nymphon striatum]